MKVSFITTVFNEENTIVQLLDSLSKQTRLSDEIIMVDGGSTDNTLSVISNFQFPISNKKSKIRILTKKGNRSVGRNEAIRIASGDIITCSDAGCILDKDWLKNIIEPFKNIDVDVVAGYYKGLPKNIFQKCLIPYVLVMPDRIDSKNFLPATRSMAFRKSIWKKTGGFNEKFSHNEDYEFARRLKKSGAKIVFVKNAIVFWTPRKNFKEAFTMFFRFAYGDSQARIFRPKVVFLFARYVIGMILLLYSFDIFIILFILYLIWATAKNYRYVKDVRAVIILPILQLTSDIAVIIGSLVGLMKR